MTLSIEFDRVSKRYRTGNALPTLRSLLQLRKNDQADKFHWAVNDVSFELRPGEALGIIGPNGAGKTTILKLLSKVTYPSSGRIVVNGRFSALIELGAGFHPDLTGRDNIYLNGIILGMRRSEINARFDQIVDFAEIGKYLDTPVKRYSSGMYARLGFAVAAHVDPDVLLVDEVLAVGDMAFRSKCYERMRQLQGNGTTLVFVSHNFGAVQKVCPRCLVMYQGHLAFDGPTAEATAEYSNILRRSASVSNLAALPESGGLSQMIMTHRAVIEDVQLLNAAGQPALTFSTGEGVRVRMLVKFYDQAPAPVFACTVRQPDGLIVYNFTTHWADQQTPDFERNTTASIEFTLKLNLTSGTYHLGVDLAYADLSSYYDRLDCAVDFVVTGGNGARGVADLQAAVVVETDALQTQDVVA
jgi:lipopolysaccharide transport system ATP-binding protein